MKKVRGSGYSGPNSTRPTQPQESDIANEGGTAPGGIVAFMGAASQWSASNAANSNPEPNVVSPVEAAQHLANLASGQAKDESPAEKGDVPIHPGFTPGKYRTAMDANPNSPDGETKSPAETGGKPLAANGRSRGESPLIPNQPRGSYRP
jgi:hypothetical protein